METESLDVVYNRVAVTVKELRDLLDPEFDLLEVLIHVKVPAGEAIIVESETAEFYIAGLTKTLERDTAEDVIVIEADQEE